MIEASARKIARKTKFDLIFPICTRIYTVNYRTDNCFISLNSFQKPFPSNSKKITDSYIFNKLVSPYTRDSNKQKLYNVIVKHVNAPIFEAEMEGIVFYRQDVMCEVSDPFWEILENRIGK